jgi:hypothetical protein
MLANGLQAKLGGLSKTHFSQPTKGYLKILSLLVSRKLFSRSGLNFCARAMTGSAQLRKTTVIRAKPFVRSNLHLLLCRLYMFRDFPLFVQPNLVRCLFLALKVNLVVPHDVEHVAYCKV